MIGQEFTEIRNWLRTQVSPRRFNHIEGVVGTAARLSQKYGVAASKARLAAWLHDCGKELSRGEMQSWLKKGKFKLDAMERRMPALWHPHVGAAIARHRWRIMDPDVLNAIRCHTLGSPKMKPLAQVLFIADFIEPNRDFEGVQFARRMARISLIEGVCTKASMTMEFLLKKGVKIHPRLLETWNAFCGKKNA